MAKEFIPRTSLSSETIRKRGASPEATILLPLLVAKLIREDKILAVLETGGLDGLITMAQDIIDKA